MHFLFIILSIPTTNTNLFSIAHLFIYTIVKAKKSEITLYFYMGKTFFTGQANETSAHNNIYSHRNLRHISLPVGCEAHASKHSSGWIIPVADLFLNKYNDVRKKVLLHNSIPEYIYYTSKRMANRSDRITKFWISSVPLISVPIGMTLIWQTLSSGIDLLVKIFNQGNFSIGLLAP